MYISSKASDILALQARKMQSHVCLTPRRPLPRVNYLFRRVPYLPTSTSCRPMAASCQSRTDRSFFSKSKNANFDASTTTTTTTTVTRRVTVVAQAAPDLRIRALKSTVHPPAPQPTPEPSETTGSKKRKSAEPPSQVTKKARKSSPPESSVTDRRMSTEVHPSPSHLTEPQPSSSSSSRRSSRHGSAARSHTPLRPARESRSRSTSVFPTEVPAPRNCWIREDGRPGPGFLSSEIVVSRLMRFYVPRTSIYLFCLCYPFYCPTVFSESVPC